MKISLTFKTPDVLDQADKDLEMYIQENHPLMEDDEVKDEVVYIKECMQKWIEYGELVHLEYDVEEDVMMVRRVSR